MAEPDSLTRYDDNDRFLDADFSKDYAHVSMRYLEPENSYRFEWLTDSDFFEVAEAIDQEYPVIYRVQTDKNSPYWMRDQSCEKIHLADISNEDRYERLDLVFDDILVSYSRNDCSRRIEENNRIRVYSSNAGIWPFKHLYSETADREESEINEVLSDIERFLGFKSQNYL